MVAKGKTEQETEEWRKIGDIGGERNENRQLNSNVWQWYGVEAEGRIAENLPPQCDLKWWHLYFNVPELAELNGVYQIALSFQTSQLIESKRRN